jgi:hypothetical protein
MPEEVKFERVSEGRWLSICGKYSVSLFRYKKMHGIREHTKVNPYYNVYAITNLSTRIGTYLKTWEDIMKIVYAHEADNETPHNS